MKLNRPDFFNGIPHADFGRQIFDLSIVISFKDHPIQEKLGPSILKLSQLQRVRVLPIGQLHTTFLNPIYIDSKNSILPKEINRLKSWAELLRFLDQKMDNQLPKTIEIKFDEIIIRKHDTKLTCESSVLEELQERITEEMKSFSRRFNFPEGTPKTHITIGRFEKGFDEKDYMQAEKILLDILNQLPIKVKVHKRHFIGVQFDGLFVPWIDQYPKSNKDGIV